MRTYAIKEIPIGSFFSKPIYLDNGFILTAPEVSISTELISALEEWGFQEVSSDGEPKSEAFAQNADIAKAAENLLNVETNNRDALLRLADEFYRLFQKYTRELYMQIPKDESLNAEAIAENVRTVCSVIRKYRHILLQIQQNHEAGADENYQIPHVVKSMILSILMGSILKLTDDKLVELGTAALLHEIGMMKLPTRLYSTKWSLTPDERKDILTHPILAYKMLKASNFPQAVCLGVLEHHERNNGSGYPRNLSTEKISLYAKIITAACSYEAITSGRPYKKAKDKHTGVLEMLKNEGKQYDETVIRALVYTLSLYPIGLYVLLSNGKKAQVVDVDNKNPKLPIVRILGMMTKDGKKAIIQTTAQLSVLRPLTRDEIY